MRTYERIIKEYLDIDAVYEYDTHSLYLKYGRDSERTTQIIKRVEKIPDTILNSYRGQLADGRVIWHELIVDRLATKICRRFYPDRFVDGAVTPMGICSRTQISFVKNHLRGWRERELELRLTDGVAAKALYDERFSGYTIGVTLEPQDLSEGRFCVVDYTTDTHSYTPGMIGYLNGMNHPGIPIPKDASLEWFKQWIR